MIEDTLGSLWRQVLDTHAVAEKQRKTQEKEMSFENEAGLIIDHIPLLFRDAASKAKQSVRLFFVTWDDITGNDPEKVDKLWQKLNAGHILTANDLTGRARIVFEWCEKEDLECFFAPEKVWMGDIEYHFCVRPKQVRGKQATS
ncbi:MAG: hypothetical protein HY455_01925 [Parcubacteria group bacterium]|nr:hypothetical protein [Parcubacteria group bacterium]